MRSASALVVLTLLVAGCASTGGGDHAAATASPAANAPAPAAPQAPVDPSVQRAFEAARGALIGGRREEAERGFQALARSNPELGGPHANLGVIYRQAGKLPESVAELELAVQDDPRQPVYWNQLGVSYRLQGQFPKARDAYQKAITLDPNYAVAYLNLGILYDLYFWESKRALENYDHYLALSPNGDEKVTKWVADLRRRQQGAQQQQGKSDAQDKLSRKEQP